MRRLVGGSLAAGLLLAGCAGGPSPAPSLPVPAVPATAAPTAARAGPQPGSGAPSGPPAAGTGAPTSGPDVTAALESLDGWSEEDHAAAFAAFRAGCGAARREAWRAACRRARAAPVLDEAAARAFFDDNFRVAPAGGAGLLTAYFAPVYEARAVPDEIFCAPVLAPPEDLSVRTEDGRRLALQVDDGGARPYPDRKEIEARPVGRALAFMKPEDLFLLQVQGSGALVFDDGRRLKAVYAADNGRPFVAVARSMIAEGLLTPGQASAGAIRDWLAAHRGPDANAVMDEDPRYVFFRLVPDDDLDPPGAAGLRLTAGRAIAVDPAFHDFGELYWIDAHAPTLEGAAPAYRRLAVALDVGGAIRGADRADLYLGRGAAAGEEAGRVRHDLRLMRLVPMESFKAADGTHVARPQG